jgi:hypothetical protein
VIAHPQDCSFQFDPVGKQTFRTGCDVAKGALANAGVPYVNGTPPVDLSPNKAKVVIGSVELDGLDARDAPKADFDAQKKAWTAKLATELKAAGYPPKADPATMNKPMVVFLLWLLVIYVTMVYGPIAAALVEMFPARIRYTSMSLPYHLGNGWLGGFLPTTAFAMVAATGNIYYGLWYPIAVAAFTAVVGFLFLKEMRGNPIEA